MRLLPICPPLFLAALVGCGPPTLVDVQREIFTPRCAAAVCHAGEQPPNELDLTEGNAAANLIDVDARGVGDRKRVVPGDPEASLLYEVTGAEVGRVARMPIGSTLTEGERELIRQWILAGAPLE